LIDRIATGDRISEWQGSVSGLITRVSDSRARAAIGQAAAVPPSSVMDLGLFFTARCLHASDRKDSTPQLPQETAALQDFDPTYVADGVSRVDFGMSATRLLTLH
jgi:hypothetical protein